MANSIAFFDALQGASYQTLSSMNFKLGIVDPDSSRLTSSQLGTLESAGKSVIGYLSIGEAEDYRSYWQSSWETSKPGWMLGQNPNWGSYYVKFWEPAWQNIVLSRATDMAKAGYDGIMLDVVDIYGVSSVSNAAGGFDKARAEMIKFVEKISDTTKAINPEFKVIQNNALDLLTVDANNPKSATNTAHMANIDGVLAESTYYTPNNTPTSWGAWNEQYLHHAVDAGKTVLAIDYPSSASAQNAFIDKAIANGFVPYVATQSLNSNILPINYEIPSELPDNAMASLLDHSGTSTPVTPPVVTPPVTTPTPTNPETNPETNPTTPTPVKPPVAETPDKPTPGKTTTEKAWWHHDHEFHEDTTPFHVTVIPNGKHTVYANTTYAEFDVRADFHGKATIKYFGTDAHDIIGIDHRLYSSVDQVMDHITYKGSNGIINLPDGHGTVTVFAAGNNGLVPENFHII